MLISKKMGEVRKSFKRLLSAFFARHIVSVLFLMLIYMGLFVYGLSSVGVKSTFDLSFRVC